MVRPRPVRPDPGSVGILLAQLGTPDAPTPAALRRYLREFLGDPRVNVLLLNLALDSALPAAGSAPNQ